MGNKFYCRDCEVACEEPEAAKADYQCPDCGAELHEKEQDTKESEKQENKNSAKAIFSLICIVAIFFVWQLNKGKIGGSAETQLINDILEKAQDINSKTPMMIDKSTRLDQVVIADQTIIYQNTLVNLTTDSTDKELFEKGIKPFLAERYCQDKKTRQALELGIKYDHEYFGKNGNLLFSATISDEDC